jgi:hypothetical protein
LPTTQPSDNDDDCAPMTSGRGGWKEGQMELATVFSILCSATAKNDPPRADTGQQ